MIQIHQLQQLIDDPSSTAEEITKAKRAQAELNVTDQLKPHPHLSRRRNAGVEMTQDDQDADIENALRPSQLTSCDRLAIRASLDPATQQILDAIGNNCLLWLFTNNLDEVPLLIKLVNSTRSDLVKAKDLDTLRLIARHSTIQAARDQASEFISQLDSSATAPIQENPTNDNE